MRVGVTFGCILGMLLALPLLADIATAAPAPKRYFSRGVKALKSGDAAKARDLFALARKSAPDSFMLQLYWAIAEQTVQPASAAALQTLEQVVTAAPTNPRAHYYLGLSYEQMKRHQEAATSFHKTLELRARFRDAGMRLAFALRSAGDADAAILAFEDVVAASSDQIAALASLTELYEGAARLEDAERALRLIARAQPTVAYHRYRLAQFFERIGEPDKAKRALKKADAIDPQLKRKMRPLKPSRR